METNFDVLLKVVLVGASGVGKSALVKRLADDQWQGPTHASTIGVDFRIKFLTVDDQRVKCQIWDTAGQERFHAMTRSYLRGAHVIFYVFDPYDQHSVDVLIEDYLKSSNRRDAKANAYEALVATKTDMGPQDSRNDQKIVSNLDMFTMSLFWTSSKDGSNVNVLLETACKHCIHAFKDEDPNENTRVIEREDEKGGCC
jgi:small GTP-binding protein